MLSVVVLTRCVIALWLSCGRFGVEWVAILDAVSVIFVSFVSGQHIEKAWGTGQ